MLCPELSDRDAEDDVDGLGWENESDWDAW